nr:M24 family metallopeptidase [candidate division Zixibacteria bacterium]
MINLERIQGFLKSEKIDAWLMADFHARNNIAVDLLDLTAHITRRSFYLIPADGQPVALVHNIEKDRFVHLPGRKLTFSSYKSLETHLAAMLSGYTRVAMEYSPKGRLPYIGLVDAGTIELVKSIGVEIVSSADIVSFFQARMTSDQIKMHKKAAVLINRIKDDIFDFISDSLRKKQHLNERMVVLRILRKFEENGMITDFPPCCAIDADICNPHYEPSESKSSPIIEGSLVLIDLWAKLKIPNSIFADITWMAYAGESVPDEYRRLFEVVTFARDKAVNFLRQKFVEGPVYGYEVDNACRSVIEEAGYGDYFFHRTGHSILENVHGPGPNIDNLETEDRRKLLAGHLFSIEPGIYLDNFGFRSEIDCLLTEDGPEVTTLPMQTEILPLMRS